MGNCYHEFLTSPPVESLENKCDDLTAYNHTLLDEKTSLAKMLAEAESRVAGGSEATHARQMEEDISRLRQQLEERDGEHSTEVEKKDKEVRGRAKGSGTKR